MNPVSIDISNYMKDEMGYTPGTNLFVSTLPITPIEVVSIFDTSGAVPNTTLDKETILKDSFQIIIRGTSYQATWNTAITIMKALHGLSNQEINNYFYQLVWLINGPNVLSMSGSTVKSPGEKGQTLLSINFNVIRKLI